MIFFNHEFLFIHNPKTAGTSLLSLFSQLVSGPYHIAGVNELGTFHPHLSLSLGYACAKTGNRPHDFKMLSVIRNPYDREISMYLYFRDVLYASGNYENNINDERISSAVKKAGSSSFSEYMRWVMDQFGSCDIWNSRNYYMSCEGELPRNLTVIKFEELQDQFERYVLSVDSLRGKLSENLMIPHLNNTYRDELDYYSDKYAERAVYESYEWAFKLGGYKRAEGLRARPDGADGRQEESSVDESLIDRFSEQTIRSYEKMEGRIDGLENQISALLQTNEITKNEFFARQSYSATKQQIVEIRDILLSHHAVLGSKLSEILRAIRPSSFSGRGSDLGRIAYLDLLESALTGILYEDPSFSPHTEEGFDFIRRTMGQDWPRSAQTMIGVARLRNLRDLMTSVVDENILGDFLEAGVWRGGACIYMRAFLAAYGVVDRKVWVADSFQGLPPPDPMYPKDDGDTHHTIDKLSVPLEEVRESFARYKLLDDQVEFIKGWFKDTLHVAPIQNLAILRLDGDMYSSTMETLNALYHKVSLGGYIIVDDYTLPGALAAVHDFRDREKIFDPIQPIDGSASFWRKS